MTSVARTLRELSEISVTRLHRLGEKKADALLSLGIGSVFDLLTTFPTRYVDRRRLVAIGDLVLDDEAVVLATVRSAAKRRSRQGRSYVEITVHDGSGSLKVVFFHQEWRSHQLSPGTEALFFGRVHDVRGRRQLTNPVVDVVAAAGRTSGHASRRTMRMVPVYRASEKAGVTSWEIAGWVEEALRRTAAVADPVPREVIDALGLEPRSAALFGIHLPEDPTYVEPARRRLAFDELLRLELVLVLRRRALLQGARAIRHEVSALDALEADRASEAGRASEASHVPGERGCEGAGGSETVVRQFLRGLPFALTGAQRRAMAAIFAEMGGPLPMHRLLQGDVGSGKTVVAAASLLAAVGGGHQGALMVPTELLAEQHTAALRALVAGVRVPTGPSRGRTRPVEVALLTSRVRGSSRAQLRSSLEHGEIDIVVGTHALLTDDVRFHSLGVAVIDEQHRFGVEQRARLREKGRSSVVGSGASSEGGDPIEPGGGDLQRAAGCDPDLLVMTATPIPRTSALTNFGDLDLVVLDELPAGRSPVETVRAERPEDEKIAWERVRSEVRAGSRAYVVCPLVAGSDRLQARAAVEELERLCLGPLSGLVLGVVHGQMPAAEREEVMERFRIGEIGVLVATTVVEVGLDVPEATVIVIEDAARFGLLQLHQLRGRVGRGERASWCFLLGRAMSADAAARLGALIETSDGFELAEVDLRLRGEGTLLGSAQSGTSDLRLASLRLDADLLEHARAAAERLVSEDPRLLEHQALADEIRLFLEPAEEAFLMKS